MSWPEVLPLVLTAALFLLVPGALVTIALGLRGLPAVALAPAVTVSIAGVLAVGLPFVSIPWSAAAVLLGGIALCGAVLLARLRFEGRAALPTAALLRPWTQTGGWVAAAFLAGAGLILIQLTLAFGTPESYSQTFDNVFHLNGIRYILDTGDASSLTMSTMTSGDSPPYFYPAAWHGLAAALIQLTGIPITVGVNVLNMAVASMVWPLGCMLLTRTVAGNRTVAVGAAGILSAAFAAFPVLLLDFGVLYPNFLSISLLPAALSGVVLMFGLGRHLTWPPLSRLILPLLLVPGLALAHPNGFMSLLVLSVPVAAQAYYLRYLRGRAYRGERRPEWRLATAGLAAATVVLVLLWAVIRPPSDAAFWGPIQSPLGAAVEVATNSAMNRPMAAGVSILMLAGLFLCWRRGGRFWMLGCFAITAVLFVIVSGAPPSFLRSAATGVWYNDSYRIAALLPMMALPFAAIATDAVAPWLRRGLSKIRSSKTGRPGRIPAKTREAVILAALVTVMVAVGTVAQLPSMTAAVASAQQNYLENNVSPLVTSDEQRIIDRLDDVVPANAVIAVNPWTGGALAYALANRETTAKHILTANTEAVETLNRDLRNAATDHEVCDAVRATRVRYALDFGTREVHGGNHPFPGLADLQDSPAMKLVLQEGEARLYELTACR
ncbi:DUF6541 family protein [Pseudarthrobacter sp. N5]|uniref:DUF6541 family protein n=1 Tax=Pseudarthrobacter sp. N5 TaxID=3418416 RepID=UPI003CF4EAA1